MHYRSHSKRHWCKHYDVTESKSKNEVAGGYSIVADEKKTEGKAETQPNKLIQWIYIPFWSALICLGLILSFIKFCSLVTQL